MSLLPCPHCARHVRAPATACPFCGAAVALTPRANVVLPRLGRAALFAASTTLAACGPSSPPPDEPAGGGSGGGESTDPSTPGPGEGDPGGVVALYGAPVPDEQGPPPSDTVPSDPGAPVAAYGGPMPGDDGPRPR
jgi:hypothetical protein